MEINRRIATQGKISWRSGEDLQTHSSLPAHLLWLFWDRYTTESRRARKKTRSTDKVQPASGRQSPPLLLRRISAHLQKCFLFFFISLRIQQGWWRLYIYVCVTCLSEQERESSTLHAGNWKECLLTHTHLSSGHRLDGGRGVLHLHVAAQSSPV